MEPSLEVFYEDWHRIEEAFLGVLDESLHPRSPDVVYDVAAALDVTGTATVLDVGCGEGRFAVALHRRFGWSVLGVDPVTGQLEQARAAAGRNRFAAGVIEALPVATSSVDLVWCREVLSHVPDLDRAFAEVGRVLGPGGRALVSQVCRTERLVPEEATGVLAGLARHPSADEVDAAAAATGLAVDRRIVLASEGGEWGEERRPAGTSRLLHAARLLRDPDRYIAQFGRTAYEIMLGDTFWHVYRMIGKLSGLIWVLSRPG
jgi:SAM-dependent methyltransferase